MDEVTEKATATYTYGTPSQSKLMTNEGVKRWSLFEKFMAPFRMTSKTHMWAKCVCGTQNTYITLFELFYEAFLTPKHVSTEAGVEVLQTKCDA